MTGDLPLTSASGSLQRLHGEKTNVSDLHRSNLLPATETHGGRQDSFEGPRPRPDPQQAADGGTITVSCQGQLIRLWL